MEDEEKNGSYRTVSSFHEEKKVGVGKTVFLPFVCGVLGASAVVGVCFGVPQIKEKLFNQSIQVTQANVAQNTSSSSNTIASNSNLISLSNYSETGIKVAEKVLPSIVGINVEYSVNTIFNQKTSASASGSGIIISADGYILTNNHIVNSSSSSSFYKVSQASKVTVYLYNDKTAYEAKIIGTDEQTDLAVIKIEKADLTAAELGDSSTLKVGEFTMAIGNPLGLQSSVTSGIVSALNREVTDSEGKKYTLIQTDAAINSGNSGGALVNSQGQVIGINTLKASGTGIEGVGFAIPINSTKDIYQQLIQFNKVKRPNIGITGIDVDEETAKYNNIVVGVYIKSIEDFSAAQKAGLKVGDVITKVNDTVITKMSEITEIKNAHKIGDILTFVVNRDGTEKTIEVTLSES